MPAAVPSATAETRAADQRRSPAPSDRAEHQRHPEPCDDCRRLHRRRDPDDHCTGEPATRDGRQQRGGHEPHEEQVNVSSADAVGEHERTCDRQPRRVGGSEPRECGQPRCGVHEEAEPDQREHPVGQHQQPGARRHLVDRTAPQQRHGAVRRQGVPPAQADGLDDRPVQHGRRRDVRRGAMPREEAVRGVAPRVGAEQRRRDHQRQRPHQSRSVHRADGHLAGADGRPQQQPGDGQQRDAGEAQGRPPALGTGPRPQVAQHVEVPDRPARGHPGVGEAAGGHAGRSDHADGRPQTTGRHGSRPEHGATLGLAG